MGDDHHILFPYSVALKLAAKYYFTGRPCKYGHVSARTVNNRMCVGCVEQFRPEWDARFRLKNVEKYRQNARDTVRRWRALNPYRWRQIRRRYKDKNPTRVAAQKKKWADENRPKMRNFLRASKARRRKSEGRFTNGDIERLFDLQSGKCAYCATKIVTGYHVDHIVPLSKGGTNWPKNLQLCCGTCNRKKASKMAEDFARSIGRLI